MIIIINIFCITESPLSNGSDYTSLPFCYSHLFGRKVRSNDRGESSRTVRPILVGITSPDVPFAFVVTIKICAMDRHEKSVWDSTLDNLHCSWD